MHRVASAIIAGIILASSTAWAEGLTCQHKAGPHTFNRAMSILIERSGSAVVVRRIAPDGSVSQDSWSYQLLAEAKGTGFRAVRLGTDRIPSESSFDVLLGGEVFVYSENGSFSAYATGTNVGSRSTVAESFACKASK